MKKHKRDSSVRAYNKGYQAGLNGKSQDQNPHETGDPRIEWATGWREGRVDNWDGFTGVASVHKLQT